MGKSCSSGGKTKQNKNPNVSKGRVRSILSGHGCRWGLTPPPPQQKGLTQTRHYIKSQGGKPNFPGSQQLPPGAARRGTPALRPTCLSCPEGKAAISLRPWRAGEVTGPPPGHTLHVATTHSSAMRVRGQGLSQLHHFRWAYCGFSDRKWEFG